MIELGHPEQLPLSSTETTPFLKDLNLMSPPSFATAGLILVSKISLILLIILSEWFGSFFEVGSFRFFFITTLFPLD